MKILLPGVITETLHFYSATVKTTWSCANCGDTRDLFKYHFLFGAPHIHKFFHVDMTLCIAKSPFITA